MRNFFKQSKWLHNLMNFDWNIFISLCTLSLLPAIFLTIRTSLISKNSSVEDLDVIGQLEWFDPINETMKAFLILPMYAIFAKLMEANKSVFGKVVFKSIFLVLIVNTLIFVIIFFSTRSLVSSINPNAPNTDEITRYLHLETVAFMIGFIFSFVNVIFVILDKSRNIYSLLLVRTILIFLDFIFIPKYGIYGIAYSNIIINSVTGIVSIFLLFLNNSISWSWFTKDDWKIVKEWAKIGSLSGFQSLFDNLIYAFIVIKMVNSVGEGGSYWITTNFIWTWLLIPVLALSEVVKKDAANDYFSLKEANYYSIVVFVIIIWCATIPTWSWFYQSVEQLENYDEIFNLTLKLFGFFIFYAFSKIPDSIYVGVGKTKYNAINSAIYNIFYYGIWAILYWTNTLNVTMDLIIIMYGGGLSLRCVISHILKYTFFKKEMFKTSLSVFNKPEMIKSVL